MFAWLKLQGGIQDADEILDKLKEEKVVVVPGDFAHCLLLQLVQDLSCFWLKQSLNCCWMLFTSY